MRYRNIISILCLFIYISILQKKWETEEKHSKVYLSSRLCTELIANLVIKRNKSPPFLPVFSHSLPLCLISLLSSFPSSVLLLSYPLLQQVLSLKVGFVFQICECGSDPQPLLSCMQKLYSTHTLLVLLLFYMLTATNFHSKLPAISGTLGTGRNSHLSCFFPMAHYSAGI